MPLVIDTEKEFDLEDLKHDIDTTRQTDRWSEAPQKIKDLFHLLEWNIIDGEHTETVEFINSALEQDIGARTLIAGPMATGIAEVGRRFKMDEYFLPEVMMSAKCMQAALQVLKPLIVAEKTEEVGTVVVGTVQGDLHDIGKKIVGMMLEAAGFTVVDLGVTVTPDQFMKAIEEHNPVIVGFSALLTTTMNMQWETLKRITAEGKSAGVEHEVREPHISADGERAAVDREVAVYRSAVANGGGPAVDRSGRRIQDSGGVQIDRAVQVYDLGGNRTVNVQRRSAAHIQIVHAVKRRPGRHRQRAGGEIDVIGDRQGVGEYFHRTAVDREGVHLLDGGNLRGSAFHDSLVEACGRSKLKVAFPLPLLGL